MTKLLDRGYVSFVEAWGSDKMIIESARMSTNKGFEGWEKDEKLLSFLYKNKHMTPFEMCGMTLEIKAPIFVFREWHRHRTQSYNEMSARYIPLPDENYMPYVSDLVHRSQQGAKALNKQAQGTKEISYGGAKGWLLELEDVYRKAQEVYEKGIALGVPKELARLPVPVGRYSRMRASANLRNWLSFLTLRTAPAAQQEIRMYAIAVEEILSTMFPRVHKLFKEDYVSE